MTGLYKYLGMLYDLASAPNVLRDTLGVKCMRQLEKMLLSCIIISFLILLQIVLLATTCVKSRILDIFTFTGVFFFFFFFFSICYILFFALMTVCIQGSKNSTSLCKT